MTAASALVPLWNRQAEWQRRLAMIADAQKFIYLTTYYIEYDDYGIGLLRALQAAQRRGVAVALLVDTFGQRMGGVLMTDEHRSALNRELDVLRADGGIVQFYDPPRLAQRVQPLALFLSAFPANLLFPLAVYGIVHYGLNPRSGSAR